MEPGRATALKAHEAPTKSLDLKRQHMKGTPKSEPVRVTAGVSPHEHILHYSGPAADQQKWRRSQWEEAGSLEDEKESGAGPMNLGAIHSLPSQPRCLKTPKFD